MTMMKRLPGARLLPQPMDETTRGTWQMVAGGLMLGTLGLFLEAAAVHPVLAVWARCVFGGLALSVWFLLTHRSRELALGGRALACALAGGVLMNINWLLFFAAIERTSIAVATMVFHVQPVLLLAFGLWRGQEAWSGRRAGAIVLALAGLGLAAGGWDAGDWTPAYLVGIVMALGGAFSYAGVTLIANQVRSVTPMALAWWQCAVGAVLLAWWPWLHGAPPAGAAWLWLAGLGVIHTGWAYVVLYAGVARLAPGRVALLQFVYPISAIVFEWLLLGRSLSASQWLGVAAMLGALAWGRRR
ncbi:MAG: hypothetical protein GAK30_01210 [Paracidovorax wautersii]|uniref:EamA domain-containing protein n=1 Tax=Paracidovorax wautersii TaxID=1177982 RepID=A0A7V8JR90_9BURK|nr:MAG: hypothetical protein GAK30_01210 [Paracidovorax wautersii]